MPLRLVVPAAGAGVRLDRFLAGVTAIGTRSQAKQLIDGGCVAVDGQRAKAARVLRAGERIAVEIPPPAPHRIEPEAIALTVLHEDPDLLVIDKPPGMVVHPAPGARSGTVVNAVLGRFGSLAGVGAADRPGIVHRLDKDTSGVLLIARTASALEALARQFRSRTLEKRYLAVVRGRVARAEGLIDRPIGRHPVERKRMSVRTRRGRAAVTRYRVLERFPWATYLELRPETGRTHQLRVHLAALGHPIVGDAVYGSQRRISRGTPLAVTSFSRQALHAARLRFAHPRTGGEMTVEAAVPADFEALLNALRQEAAKAEKSDRSA